MHTLPKRFVYFLRSLANPNRTYTGLTSDVATRLTAHNAGRVPSTERHGPWELVAVVAFEGPALLNNLAVAQRVPSGISGQWRPGKASEHLRDADDRRESDHVGLRDGRVGAVVQPPDRHRATRLQGAVAIHELLTRAR
jgi:hypothetical protein